MLDVRFNELNLLAVVLLIKRRIKVLVVASQCECSCGRPRNLGPIRCGWKLYGGEEVDRVLNEEDCVKSRFIMNHFMTFKVMRLGDES